MELADLPTNGETTWNINGGGQADVISGGNLPESIGGASGADTIHVSGGSDRINLTDGTIKYVDTVVDSVPGLNNTVTIFDFDVSNTGGIQ